MWHWDQGRLPYFQFDAVRQISTFVTAHNFKAATREELVDAIGLPFAPKNYTPWRNYSRILKTCLLVSEEGEIARPTPVAESLAQPGAVTSDEYFHFLARAYTEPSPALSDWTPSAHVRYPLLFTLKYLLARTQIERWPIASVDEIIGAYRASEFVGEEPEAEFISLASAHAGFSSTGCPENLRRQARESVRVLAQLSYLHYSSHKSISISLHPKDALPQMRRLNPIGGSRATDAESELRRVAGMFHGALDGRALEYPNTIANDVVQSGFREGNKVKRIHLAIERNQALRKAFFSSTPTTRCDMCSLETATTYPWAERILELHHLLPLSSGIRVNKKGTTLDDLVAVCPTCHRAIHRYYDRWLHDNKLADFPNEAEAHAVYKGMKANFKGAIHA